MDTYMPRLEGQRSMAYCAPTLPPKPHTGINNYAPGKLFRANKLNIKLILFEVFAHKILLCGGKSTVSNNIKKNG